jgi:bacillithiol biosynthesis cysteine-adding enzyme BshC
VGFRYALYHPGLAWGNLFIVTANGSSSSPAPAAERLSVDLVEAGLVAPLPRAYLEGRDLDLLEPLRFLPPGELPDGAPAGAAPDRRGVAEALRVANRAYGHPGADRLAGRLAEAETLVVVGGQQPGLFGGPLYTLSKMVAAGRWAEAMEEATGTPAVAVFWVATEDHDWHEVSRATFLSPDGPRRFDLGEDPDPLLPVGMRTLGAGVREIFAALPELRSSDRYEEWVETLARIYRPDARFGEAFSRWAVAVLGERCPLLLDAMDPGIKEAEAPWLARLVEERAAWEEASAEADRRIEERGHPLQVHPQRASSPLFELRGGERRRIEWVDGGEEGYHLRGAEAGARPVADLLEKIEDNPSVVSPGVLARPAIQDALLGTTLQVLGPGEVSYMAQAAPAYRVLGVAAPWIALRPQVLVLEGHHREKLEELGLPLAALLGPEDALERRLAGENGAGFVERTREELAAALAALGEEAASLDPNLERPFEKTREHVLRSLDTFAGKVTAAAARRDGVRARRVDRLRQVCLPGGALQERVISSSHFPGKYGERFVEALWEQMELDGRRLQVIEP